MAPSDPRLDKLRAAVRSTGSAAVAFSGGADSALVAKVAREELGGKAVAVTVDSPLYPRSELRGARATAKAIGIRHVVVRTDPLSYPGFSKNPRDRCYICKLRTFKEVMGVADARSLAHVLDGSNADDERSFRPGLRAKRELGVRSPLAEAGMGKRDVERISRKLGLATHGKAPSPCLATRVPYGDELTPGLLARIEKAEDHLRGMGFEQVRVRAHGDTARVEVAKRQVRALTRPDVADAVVRRLKNLGFAYVAVDLEGYRSGSMDEVARG
ncbi:MAG: ATP-dependent sacrificial sulfur transferase LarE [Thermoplasmata archaeon]